MGISAISSQKQLIQKGGSDPETVPSIEVLPGKETEVGRKINATSCLSLFFYCVKINSTIHVVSAIKWREKHEELVETVHFKNC